MKVGCTAYSYRKPLTDGRMKLEDFLRICYDLRVDGVELTGYYFESRDRGYLRRLKRLCLDFGLDISGVATRSDFCRSSREDRVREARMVGEWVETAYYLGAPFLRVFAGVPPEGSRLDEALNWAVDGLRLCIPYCEEYGVALAVENHGGVTSTAEQVSRILESVGSEWVRLNLDLGNYRVDPYREVADTAKYAVNVHAKIYKASVESVDEKLDYRRMVGILRDRGYNGYLSVEYEGEEPAEYAVPKALEALKKLV